MSLVGYWLPDYVCTELSVTVPIVNTVAFLFTVIGEWWVEGKVISRGMSPVRLLVAALQRDADNGQDTMFGMLLSVGGLAVCVHSKNVA